MSFLNNKVSKDTSDFIWNLAELLRGPYKKDHYKDVILPLCVIRRFDCVLEPTKEKVLAKYEEKKDSNINDLDLILNRESSYNFHNHSPFNFKKLLDDQDNIAANLKYYINGFSKNVRDILEHFKFDKEIDNLEKHDLLYLILKEFNRVDLHPDIVSNRDMGLIFEDLMKMQKLEIILPLEK